MLRKFFLLVLFIGFIALVFSLLTAEQGGSGWLSSQANPSQKPLPQAWSNDGRAVVRLAGRSSDVAEADAGIPSSGACPAQVTIQQGDTLGAIAKNCGVSLTDLLVANPSISNANRIYPGQQVQIYGARGGADPAMVAAEPPPGGFTPGAQVVLDAEGFPPAANVKVGIGLPGTGFQSVGVYTADAQGRLSASLTIPPSARAGERAFFLLSASGVPSVQIISDAFVISQ